MYTVVLLPGSPRNLPRKTMPLAGAAPNFPAPSSYPSPLPLNKIRRFLTPLDATLPRPLASAHSKPLTKNLNPLSATLTKNPGGPLRLWLTRFANLVLRSYFRAAFKILPRPFPLNIPEFNAFRKTNSAPPVARPQFSLIPETAPAAAPELSLSRLSKC